MAPATRAAGGPPWRASGSHGPRDSSVGRKRRSSSCTNSEVAATAGDPVRSAPGEADPVVEGQLLGPTGRIDAGRLERTGGDVVGRSEEHTSELQSLMRNT